MHVITRHCCLDRGTAFLPVRKQLIDPGRVKAIAGKNVGADFGTLFDDDDGEVSVQLQQAARRRQAGGSAAYDDDIEFHGFAFV